MEVDSSNLQDDSEATVLGGDHIQKPRNSSYDEGLLGEQENNVQKSEDDDNNKDLFVEQQCPICNFIMPLTLKSCPSCELIDNLTLRNHEATRRAHSGEEKKT